MTVTAEQQMAAKVLEAVEEYPETLNMHDWATDGLTPDEHPATCGTTLCLAGWTAHLLGYVIEDEDGWAHHPVSERRDHVFSIAREALGLDVDQAIALFNKSSVPQALALLRGLADGHGFPPPPLPVQTSLDY